MRSFVFIFILILMLSVPATAQDRPAVEIFGGFSYAHLDSGVDMSSGSGGGIMSRSLIMTSGAFGNSHVNLNGWNASTTTYLARRFGMTADFSGHYGSPGGIATPTHSYLFGPQVRLHSGRFAPFARTLFGLTHTKATSGGGELFHQQTFAMTAGGGFDWRVSPRMAVRVMQAEFLLTRFGGNSQHNFRYSTGVVFRFGNK